MRNLLSACFLALICLPVLADPMALNVRDFGAVGDAQTDDTPAFQKALDTAGKDGSRVFVPPGKYLLKGQLTLPEFVTLEGTFTAPARSFDASNNLAKTKGSILFTTAGKNDPDGKPFITLQSASTIKGLIIFYPEQTFDIVPYPWCIRGVGDNCSVRDMLLVNPYQAVDFGTQPAGRHFISGLYAQALKTGIFVDKCFDIGRIENVHFWPFWNEKLMDWTTKNGTAFVLARTDWEYMRDCFCISYKVGYHFIANKDGPGNVDLTQCGSDTGPCAVKVEATQQHAGVTFSNSQFMAGIEIADTNSGPIKFTSCGFWGVNGLTDHHAQISGKGTVTFTACHFISWATVHHDSPCILAHSGGLIVNGCEFLDEDASKTHIKLEKNVDAAIVSGNRYRSPMKIANESEGSVEISGNVGPKPAH
jgi:hypothetical protein